MRPLSLLLIVLFAIPVSSAHAQTAKLVEIKSKIYAEYRFLDETLPTTKDAGIVYTAENTCAMTVLRLDAYFSMAGIVNSVGEKAINKSAIDQMLSWINEAKRVNTQNIKSLIAITQATPETLTEIKKLQGYFLELGVNLDSEIKRLSELSNAFPGASKK